MELLPVDEKATRNMAEYYLNQYRTKKSFAERPEININPKVTESFGDGASHATTPRAPYAEQRVMDIAAAQRYCDWIDWAIKSVPKYKHRELLKIRYCEHDEPTDSQCMDRLINRLGHEIGSTTYFSWKKDAELAVADFLQCVIYRAEKTGVKRV